SLGNLRVGQSADNQRSDFVLATSKRAVRRGHRVLDSRPTFTFKHCWLHCERDRVRCTHSPALSQQRGEHRIVELRPNAAQVTLECNVVKRIPNRPTCEPNRVGGAKQSRGPVRLCPRAKDGGGPVEQLAERWT